jgi:predicted permease
MTGAERSSPQKSGNDRGLHARAFRVLLHLYPSNFRDAWGEEMTSFFLHRLNRARNRGGHLAVLELWARTIADIARTATAERAGAPAQIPPRRGDHPVSSFLLDLRYAARRLRRTPLFTISAILILAVGIGLNATVFSLVDAMLFRPPPFANPEEIVHIYQDSDEGEPSSTAFPAYRDIAATTGIFAAVAATSDAEASLDDRDGPRPVAVQFATASYFDVLGLQPYRGRWFEPEHDRVAGEMVAVVSYRTWRTQLGAAEDVIGSTIRLNNHPVTVIGIGPREFNGEAGALLTDFWLSISSTPVGGPYRVANLDRREDHWYQVKARLAPGVAIGQARGAMTALAQRMGELYPELDRGREITVFRHDEVRFHPDVDGGLAAASAGVLTVAALVLLLACTNLANLLLVRGIARTPEMAVRVALGAGRARVVRLMLLEAVLLAALGGVAGLALAAWSVGLIPLLPIPAPGGGLDVSFDHRVVVFGLLITLVTGLLFGLLPAIRSTRTDVSTMLREQGWGLSTGRRISLVRNTLVAMQVAVSAVLVVGAGLLARSLANAERGDSGVDAPRIAVLGTNLESSGVADGEAAAVVGQMLERVEALPGVESAALTTRLPVTPGGTTTQVIDGYEPRVGTGSVELPFAFVTRRYFETMAIPLLAGRAFTADDRPGMARVVVVNETAARLFWGGNAVGGRIRSQSSTGAWREVVGVVGDVKVGDIREPPTPMFYISAEQAGVSPSIVVARTRGDPAALINPLRTALRDVRSTLAVTRLVTFEAHLGSALADLRTATALLGIFSLLALLLASLGVYAAVSFTVERRLQELGIRLALGAPRSRIVGMVVGQSLVVVAMGLTAGLSLAVLATRGLEGMLFGVGAVDQATFAAAGVVLLLAAGVAAFLPARRAARADPAEVLRGQARPL